MLPLGESVGKDVVTPIDIVSGASDETHPKVVGIARLLQTMDEDGDLGNGIKISDGIRRELEGASFNLNDIENDSELTSRLDAINAANLFTSDGPRTLITTEQAQNHLREYLNNIGNSHIPPSITVPNLEWLWDRNFEMDASRFVTITNGDPILGYGLSDATRLPSGLSFDSGTGIFSGTPAETGNFNISIRVKDRDGWSGYNAFSLSISTTTETGSFLPIYFDYQSSALRPDQLARMNAIVVYLLANPALKLRIEGNTDERGSDEENMTLGGEMAVSVRDFFIEKDVDPLRLSWISYGEEKPADPGVDELARAHNRRVTLVIIR